MLNIPREFQQAVLKGSAKFKTNKNPESSCCFLAKEGRKQKPATSEHMIIQGSHVEKLYAQVKIRNA